MTPDILQAALEEFYRIEDRLRANRDFQRREALRRVIELYQQGAEHPGQGDRVVPPDLLVNLVPQQNSACSERPPAHEVTTLSHAAAPGPPVSRLRGGWAKGNSQASRIRDAAEQHLRETGERAPGGSIYEAIVKKGVEVRGRKPAAVVAAALSASGKFDNTDEGYGLLEWSNGGAALPIKSVPPENSSGTDRSSDREIVLSRPAAASDRSPSRRPGGWTKGNSKTSRLRDALVAHLRETKRHATGGQIYKAMLAKGVEVGGKKPQSTVTAQLAGSDVFYHADEGYGLREWLTGGEVLPNGKG